MEKERAKIQLQSIERQSQNMKKKLEFVAKLSETANEEKSSDLLLKDPIEIQNWLAQTEKIGIRNLNEFNHEPVEELPNKYHGCEGARYGKINPRKLPELPELPKLGNSYREWPEFIANYNETTTNLENLGRIRKALYGKASELVKGSLIYLEAVPKVIDILTMNFGDPEIILEQLEKEIEKLPKIRENLNGIQTLTARIANLNNSIIACGLPEELITNSESAE